MRDAPPANGMEPGEETVEEPVLGSRSISTH